MANFKSRKQRRREAEEEEARAAAARKPVYGPSPNPVTNLILADIALRSGGQLLRLAIERTLLENRYVPGKGRNIVAGRSMSQMLVGTALARFATRSVPGAVVVGGGLVAKTLYDRVRNRRRAQADPATAIVDQAKADAKARR